MRDYVFPMFRANAIYEGVYLLGTSIARPLIARRQIEIARETGADAVAHGATGKGNDQVRFELGYYAHDPGIRVIAPWRVWDIDSREALVEYAERHQIPIPRDKRGEPPYSTDANLLHISYEGKALEDPWVGPDESMFTRSVSPQAAPDRPTTIEIDFEAGDPVAVDGKTLSPAALLERLNQLGGANGIGRVDLVENRFVGMKSRGVYETPGGTILIAAHRAMESLTLDRAAAHLKDELMPRYAELVYNGFWFAPERRMLQAAIDESQRGRHRHRAARPLQGLGDGGRPQGADEPLQCGARHLRGRFGLRPARRRRLHQAERPPPAVGQDWGGRVGRRPLATQQARSLTRSGRKMRGHGIRMGANAAICVVRPGVKKAPIRTGNEDYFVTGHRCRETFDLFPVPGPCSVIHRFSACRPDFRLRIDIEEYGREAAQLEPLVDRGSERKGMLEQLSRIQLLVAARFATQSVANAFVSLHAFAPDRAPICVAQHRLFLASERFESF